MAWSMPSSGAWNPGIAMAPNMNMGSFTPDQWTMMQQQNWQQWTQWQQQYAQWQSQYGDKYMQQMQAMHAMSGIPPLPSGAMPPPAPPPDKPPPPPPPHENDQPLYSGVQPKITPTPTSVKPQQNIQPNYNNDNNSTGNSKNWSSTADASTEKQTSQAVNTEALKKLAEEEKLFDIQFQKWEEEIEKWKKENVNHPDKQAYAEYEQKFEACRVQLLERRKQMNLKRASLMGDTASTNTNTGNNTSPAIPPPTNINITNYPPNVPLKVQTQQNKVPYYTNKNQPQYQQFDKATHQNYTRNESESAEPQDRYESYDNSYNDSYNDYDMNEDYASSPVNSSFLPTNKSSKDIPGLDLVPEVERSNNQDVIDITDESISTQQQKMQQHQQQNIDAPDYSKISKGINNILGDEKIMNILSMVTSQKPPINNQAESSQLNTTHSQKQWGENSSNYYNKDYSKQQSNNQQYSNQQHSNQQYNQPQTMHYRQQNINNIQNIQRQSVNSNYPELVHQRFEGNFGDVGGNRHIEMQQEQFYDRQTQHDEQNLPLRGPQAFRHNIPPPQPLLQNISSQKVFNDFQSSGFERSDIQQNVNSINHPVKPKWVVEPMFTPSIIVEYEHKPLRLKARDFIEPVHMFDYNHKSKDSDSNVKKDFEKEVDELFSRSSRRAESDDWNSEKLYSRDYDRRQNRDDFRDRVKMPNRDGHDVYNKKTDDRFEDRRYDDHDRFRRPDYDRRDRGDDHERIRDLGRDRDYGRDRQIGMDRNLVKERDPVKERDMFRDRDLDRDRERDSGKERDLARDRDLGRERELIRDRDGGREIDVGRGRDNGRDRDIGRERDFRDRNLVRDKIRDRRDISRNRSRSRDRDSRKREHSRENESNEIVFSKKAKDAALAEVNKPKHIVMIDDLLELPGREMRPAKIVIILRGPPGSGKSYLAKLIRDKEAEHGGTVRIMSIDDYFMQEGEIEEKDPTTGKIIKKPSLKYEYDEKLEENYINSLKRAFKRSLTDGYFSFLIFDAVNDQLKSYADIWNYARQNSFQVYICTMELDSQVCFKRNIHNRQLEEIEVITSRFFPTPAHHIQLDPTTLLQNASIPEVQMEDAEDVTMEDADIVEVESSFTSKWEKMEDAAQLARLDGTAKPLRASRLTMEDYLQLDEWKPTAAKPGKKTVRWADLEERREQEKIRAIGFVVGQTDWNRMTDPTMGSSALTQTKYIERVRRS